MVKEMFEIKYMEVMANITPIAWKNAKFYAEQKHIPVHQEIMMGIEVTQHDLTKWGVFYYGTELERLHKAKCIASNRHRQEHGHVDRYWLTPKGYKAIFAE